MPSAEAVELSRIVVHGFPPQGEPEITEHELVVTPGLRAFFEAHICNCLRPTAFATAKFKASSATVSTCAASTLEAPESLVEQSKAIALWFAHCAAHPARGRTFLAVALFRDATGNDTRVALLFMDPVSAFVKSSREAPSLEEIEILPDPSRQLSRFAIVRPYDDDARTEILYRNQPASPDEPSEVAEAWLGQFLEAIDIPTPRQLTQLVVKETEKWIEANQDTLDAESACRLRNAVRTTAQTEELDIEQIAAAALPDEHARDAFIGRLLDRGLTETAFAPDRNWAEDMSRRTTYICDYGVRISGPTDSIDHVVQVMPKTEDRKTRLVVETRKFVQR